MAQVTAEVVGTQLTGRTIFRQPFRLGFPATVTLRWNLEGSQTRILFATITYASSGKLTGPGGTVWEGGSGSRGSSGSKQLQLQPGDYTIEVSADKGKRARVEIEIPEPPPAPPPAPPVPPSTAPAPPVTQQPATSQQPTGQMVSASGQPAAGPVAQLVSAVRQLPPVAWVGGGLLVGGTLILVLRPRGRGSRR